MPVAWHPKGWWDWCVSVDQMIKKIDPMFIEVLLKGESVVYNMEVLKHFELTIYKDFEL